MVGSDKSNVTYIDIYDNQYQDDVIFSLMDTCTCKNLMDLKRNLVELHKLT